MKQNKDISQNHQLIREAAADWPIDEEILVESLDTDFDPVEYYNEFYEDLDDFDPSELDYHIDPCFEEDHWPVIEP